ncbi:MAG: hypothetical protein AABN33_09405 [Acidobacteriota bacterium]
MRAYIVWLPIFGGDFKGEARKLSNSFQDRRVSYFLDPKSETAKQFERVLKTERFIAWDVYLLYGADASWEEEPPQPAFWMHQLSGVTKAPTFDEQTFRAKLKGMLNEMKAPPTNSPANGRAKIEFLYFNSCPGHKQALANLKAALRESKISADLALINVTSEAQGAKVGFQGSPSIRVNGKDLDGRNEGHSYGCRIYQIDGKITPTPTKEFIRENLKELTR